MSWPFGTSQRRTSRLPSSSRLIGNFARACLVLALALVVAPRAALAAKILLKDGRTLEGSPARLAAIADDPKKEYPEGAPVPLLITMIDDELRRTFIPTRQIAQLLEGGAAPLAERFLLKQPVPTGGSQVNNVGMILDIQPFDEHGRRIFRMGQPEGMPIDIIQGITAITPVWTKVEGLTSSWDMRIATSSIPRDQLSQILQNYVDPTKVDDRLKVARLYLQSERYTDARAELEQVIKDFPDFQQQIEPVVVELKQLSARRLLSEIELRRSAGQHQLAYSMLEKFPAEGVAGEILQQVRQMMDLYKTEYTQAEAFKSSFAAQVSSIDDADRRARLTEAQAEMFAELDNDTLDRIAAYLRLVDDPKLEPGHKVALALSGWLVGANGASDNLDVALSMYKMRTLAVKYFNEPNRVIRDQLLAEILSQEGASPELVAKLLAFMQPPYPLPEQTEEIAGLYRLTVPGVSPDPEFEYLIQLPPEYDPHRRYPVVVTLNGAGTTPEQQIDWWAGGWDEKSKMRLGQATRNGYIVIAPTWAAPGQGSYDYSARAHAAVLWTLRDACRRFAIDTDRVFLSGHSMGGDAAWDLGVSHPDLWAGVIPIVAVSDRYDAFLWGNAKRVPFYVVSGELDGGKMIKNARDLDRCLTGNGFNFTVVEYRGRGHEHFSDEILRLFDWMARFKREFIPREFVCKAMRPWENYFWWVEVSDFPERVVVNPGAWPPPKNYRPMLVEAELSANNGLSVQTGAGKVIVYLTPEMLDFGQKVNITIKGKRVARSTPFIQPDLSLMLEDVRTRGDRLHPFWAKVESP